MYTKARIAGHPIHPMLVAFPVAFYTATAVAILAHIGTQDPFWYRAAFFLNVAGVVMAAVAAIPGLIDLLLAVPRNTKARTTGIGHATLNVAALVVFVLSAVILGHGLYAMGATMNDTAPLVLSLIGVAATIGAGALGWALVQTHHVGIRPTHLPSSPRSPDEVDDLDELIMPPPEAAEGPRPTLH